MTRAVRCLAMLLSLLACATVHANDVTVELLRFGVGSHVRPGDPTGILVKLTSNLQEPVQTRVQWELKNADGDTALYSRDIPLAPGSPTERWLYGVLPINSSSALAALDMVTVVRVLQVDNGRVLRELAVARLIGTAAAEQPSPVEVNEGLIGVLGDGRAGLAPLSPVPGLGSSDGVPSMNEVTRVARGIQAGSLPDHWEGLASYSTLIWGNAPQQNLGPEQARALLDWIRRGGHLVILLPDSGDPWGVLAGRGGRTPLAEVLPAGGVTRNEGVLVKDLMPLISRTPELRNPTARTTLWTFDVAATQGGYQSVMAMPCAVDARTGNLTPQEGTLQGATIAIRRLLNFGAVTVVGIDADGLDRRALNADGLPQTDIFWNRLIGRRADAPSAREWVEIDKAKRRVPQSLISELSADGGRLIGGEIGMRGAAAIGVLGLVVAFGAYWLLAGPGIFYTLRSMKKAQYAWLGFVLVAITATVVTWMATGVSEFKGGRVKHITYLDRVESADFNSEERAVVRVNTWFSAGLPGYGPTQVSLRKGVGGAGPDGLWTWFAPPQGSSDGFPDTERYVVSLNSPADYEMPSRATSTVLSAAWMGDPSSQWSALPSVVQGSQLRQDLSWGRDDAVPDVILHGQLVHNLPAALENVMLIHVNPTRSPQRKQASVDSMLIVPSDGLPNYGRMRVVPKWQPNVPLNIANELYGQDRSGVITASAVNGRDNDLNQSLTKKYIEPVIKQRSIQLQDTYSQQDRLAVLNFYSMLPQPKYLLSVADSKKADNPFPSESITAHIYRDLARTVDLSLWFTRPCLIIIGTLNDDSESTIDAPFPILIDGDTPKSEGRTVVRVIFPLPDAPGTISPPLP